MLPCKLRKRHILPASQNLLSVYFSLAKFQLVSCNLSLAIIWQRTYTHKLPKLCSATLSRISHVNRIERSAIQGVVAFGFVKKCFDHKYIYEKTVPVIYIQLFRERLSEKNVHATIPKGNMGYDRYTVPDDCSCRTYFCCFPLALANTFSSPFVPILSNFSEEQ